MVPELVPGLELPFNCFSSPSLWLMVMITLLSLLVIKLSWAASPCALGNSCLPAVGRWNILMERLSISDE